MNKRIKGLVELRQQAEDILEGGAGLEVELDVPGDDGTTTPEVFTFPNPGLFTDEQTEAFGVVAKGDNNNAVALVKAILNNDTDLDADKFDRFRRAGGQSSLVMSVWSNEIEKTSKSETKDQK